MTRLLLSYGVAGGRWVTADMKPHATQYDATTQSADATHKQCPCRGGVMDLQVQEGLCSVSSGVGTRPWPSVDVDPGFIIQLLQDSLLFDGQDGVANWTTAR